MAALELAPDIDAGTGGPAVPATPQLWPEAGTGGPTDVELAAALEGDFPLTPEPQPSSPQRWTPPPPARAGGRRRLRKKTKPAVQDALHPAHPGAVPQAASKAVQHHVPAEPVAAGALVSAADLQHVGVYELLRKLHAVEFWRSADNNKVAELRARQRRPLQRAAFTQTSLAERMVLLQKALALPHLPEQLRCTMEELCENWKDRLLRGCSTRGRRQSQKKEKLGPHALFTFTGPGWVVPPELLRVDDSTTESSLCGALRAQEEVKDFWRACLRHVQAMLCTLGGHKYSACLEVCLGTWSESGVLRLHMHVCVEAAASGQLALPSVADLVFLGVPPQISGKGKWNTTRLRRSCAGSAHYYCQAPKRGQLFMERTTQAFSEFPVNPEWVTSLLQAEKLDEDTAWGEYVKTCKNVDHHLGNLMRLKHERKKARLEEKVSMITASLSLQVAAFRYVPAVSEQWLPQYERIRSRYKFLVLNGPSGTGKTYFAKHILGDPDKVFEVNCANTPEPDLRGFDPELHCGILFDEASPQLVSDQRKLFQAPPCWIDLGCSTTNCHKYRVFVSGAKLMVCTNSWHEACQSLRYESDKAWVRDNSVVVDVTEPLWIAES